jgi:tyrosyl-tRNA synthetase
MGGSDQWGNIVAGIDLVRKIRQETVFGMTFPLITTSSGVKMGKTAKGAVWLDPLRTSPYDYFQFWINTDDRDVTRFLSLFTFLPMDEIREARKLSGADLNHAKRVLAFEATVLAHGAQEALAAYEAASRVFGGRAVPEAILPTSRIPRGLSEGEAAIPQSSVTAGALQEGIPAFKLFQMAGLTNSGGAGRRLVAQGGAYMNGSRLEAFDQIITLDDVQEGALLLRAGKKRFHKLVVVA